MIYKTWPARVITGFQSNVQRTFTIYFYCWWQYVYCKQAGTADQYGRRMSALLYLHMHVHMHLHACTYASTCHVHKRLNLCTTCKHPGGYKNCRGFMVFDGQFIVNLFLQTWATRGLRQHVTIPKISSAVRKKLSSVQISDSIKVLQGRLRDVYVG